MSCRVPTVFVSNGATHRSHATTDVHRTFSEFLTRKAPHRTEQLIFFKDMKKKNKVLPDEQYHGLNHTCPEPKNPKKKVDEVWEKEFDRSEHVSAQTWYYTSINSARHRKLFSTNKKWLTLSCEASLLPLVCCMYRCCCTILLHAAVSHQIITVSQGIPSYPVTPHGTRHRLSAVSRRLPTTFNDLPGYTTTHIP